MFYISALGSEFVDKDFCRHVLLYLCVSLLLLNYISCSCVSLWLVFEQSFIYIYETLEHEIIVDWNLLVKHSENSCIPGSKSAKAVLVTDRFHWITTTLHRSAQKALIGWCDQYHAGCSQPHGLYRNPLQALSVWVVSEWPCLHPIPVEHLVSVWVVIDWPRLSTDPHCRWYVQYFIDRSTLGMMCSIL